MWTLKLTNNMGHNTRWNHTYARTHTHTPRASDTCKTSRWQTGQTATRQVTRDSREDPSGPHRCHPSRVCVCVCVSERERTELYYSRIEILGSSPFLQSVLVKLHRQHISRLFMTLSKLTQYYKTVATSILAIQLTIGTTRLLMNVIGNIF